MIVYLSDEDTYLSDISSANLRQIWVFPIPPIPESRQERLDINLLSARWTKIFPSLSSTSLRPVNIGLEFCFWSKGTFVCICLSWALGGWTLILQIKYVQLLLDYLGSLWGKLTKVPPVMSISRKFAKKLDPVFWVCWPSAKPRTTWDTVSNSQRNFVLIPRILALRHQVRRAQSSCGCLEACAKWVIISTNHGHEWNMAETDRGRSWVTSKAKLPGHSRHQCWNRYRTRLGHCVWCFELCSSDRRDRSVFDVDAGEW